MRGAAMRPDSTEPPPEGQTEVAGMRGCLRRLWYRTAVPCVRCMSDGGKSYVARFARGKKRSSRRGRGAFLWIADKKLEPLSGSVLLFSIARSQRYGATLATGAMYSPYFLAFLAGFFAAGFLAAF